MPYLVIGEEEKRVVTLTGERMEIGRYPELDITLYDDRVSRYHAEIRRKGEQWLLVDLGSRNGTRLNGVRIEPRQDYPLAARDEIEIGGTTFRFEEHLSEPASVVTAIETATLERTARSITDLSRLSTADQRLALLYRLGEAVRAQNDIDALLEKIVEVLFQTFHPERGFIGILEQGTSRWKRVHGRLRRGGRVERIFPEVDRVVREVVATRRAMLSVPRSAGSEGGSIEIRSEREFLCAPLEAKEASLGVIYLDRNVRKPPFTQEDLKFLSFLGLFSAGVLAGALAHDRLQRKAMALEEDAPVVDFEPSPAMEAIARRLPEIAASPFPVLLLGETGTGKTTLAREIHRLSPRREGPFVKVNCAAIPETLLESELFGYAKRSGIANADPKGKPGKFELADAGTLFLDEIGEMPLSQQAKLLDVLEDGLVTRLGGTKPVRVDVRVIAATARPLDLAAPGERLRSDLFHRLSRVTLTMPPLRKRRGDIPGIARQALANLLRDFPKPIAGISDRAIARLQAHDWPGNIRELENVLAQALLECPQGGEILPEHLRILSTKDVIVDEDIELRCTRSEAEFSLKDRERRRQVIEAVRSTASFAQAARKMGISKQWMSVLIRKYGIEVIRHRK
ncbi:MAG: FHA domain-containing protein [Deltaproteobacteria bacterium]|nr:MAG: FHA domain-containing protein [Deltaproteobacteria bacterium]